MPFPNPLSPFPFFSLGGGIPPPPFASTLPSTASSKPAICSEIISLITSFSINLNAFRLISSVEIFLGTSSYPISCPCSFALILSCSLSLIVDTLNRLSSSSTCFSSSPSEPCPSTFLPSTSNPDSSCSQTSSSKSISSSDFLKLRMSCSSAWSSVS